MGSGGVGRYEGEAKSEAWVTGCQYFTTPVSFRPMVTLPSDRGRIVQHRQKQANQHQNPEPTSDNHRRSLTSDG